MKNTFLIPLICIICFISCKTENASDKITDKQVNEAKITDENANKFPVITFDKKVHDFGEMNQKESVKTSFKYTNTGDAPLVVVDIKASCGCTVPDGWSRKPLMPGETGSFDVTFNSGKKRGNVNKAITVTSNTKNRQDRVNIKVAINTPEVDNKVTDRNKNKRTKK